MTKAKRFVTAIVALVSLAVLLAPAAPGAFAKPQTGKTEEWIAGVDLAGLDVGGFAIDPDSRTVVAGRVVCTLSAPLRSPIVLELAIRDSGDEARRDVEAFRATCERELETATNAGVALPPGAWVAVRGRAVGVVVFAETNAFVAVRGASGVAEVAREVHRRLLAAQRVDDLKDIPRPEVVVRAPKAPLAPGDEHLLEYEARAIAGTPLELHWRSDRASLVPDGADCWFRADEAGDYVVELTALSALNLAGTGQATIEVR